MQGMASVVHKEEGKGRKRRRGGLVLLVLVLIPL